METQAQKFTPGPWIVREATAHNQTDYLIEGESASDHHATVHGFDASPDESAKANARLIAAAPELFEACKMALIQIRQDNDERKAEHRGTEWQLKAAIAKAIG